MYYDSTFDLFQIIALKVTINYQSFLHKLLQLTNIRSISYTFLQAPSCVHAVFFLTAPRRTRLQQQQIIVSFDDSFIHLHHIRLLVYIH
jgi:hypothetical protein